MSETFDFEDGNGPVPAHRHKNPDGSEGGWVAETAFVSKTATVGPNAQVFGQARVYDDASISGNAQVFENTILSGDVVVSGQNLRAELEKVQARRVQGKRVIGW
ncbi:hypothetical protein [Ferrovum myxofaciens]|uniref:Polymer-forming cytoskeletal protein n=1 Tax=Ferrovum myxofaciens TaxID=416213 RepID=A0A9E6SYA9_9PROT|nr:hypothetical protein [Ferrovum myxofaciens]QKE37355.1 MAG: hypothetical protein HO273_00300 [Ferrovum myxofaciens]QWY75011.1 MAG: hypothetical protein JVY19_00770 [Ferrovum myxofaciens]QWY77751.1 MAG: hypothetical protein JZL65_01300 [Ferrovum myxofaciens]